MLTKGLEEALAQGQVERVRELLSELLQGSRLSSDVLLRVGVGLARQEFYADSAVVFQRCAREHPGIFECHYNLALVDLALRNLPEALAALENAPRGSRPEELARRYLRGKVLDALGRSAEAEQELLAAFSGAPDQENYSLDLGLFYLRAGAYPRAAEVFERGKTFNRRSPFLGLGLAVAQFLGGRTTESVETCRTLLGREPDFSPARLLLAFAQYLDGRFAEAEKVIAAGLDSSNPHPYLSYLHAAVLLKLQSKDYDRMLSDISRVTRAVPACTLCYLTVSKVRQAQGDYPAAIQDLETAVSLDSGFSEAWYRLAQLYDHMGRRTEAGRARLRFQELKAEKIDRESEMIRKMFLQTLGGAESPSALR